MALSIHNLGLPSSNPLDIAEQIVHSRNWNFDRPFDDELVAEITGKLSNHRLWLSWHPDLSGLTFSCGYDIKVAPHALTNIYRLVGLINERLWIGHFDICSEDNSISYRHSTIVKDGSQAASDYIEEIVDVAVDECERFYPAFQSVIWGGQTPEKAVEFALFETFGEA